jgi:hypothetical protein
MYELLWLRISRRRMTLGAVALTCVAIAHAIAAGGCGPNDAIIHDECFDAGATDAGDAGAGGASSDPACN